MKRPRKRPAAPPEKLGAQPDGGYEKSHGYGPSHGGPSGPGDAPATAPARATKDRGEVLLVDDDADFRAILGEVLKAEGCTVREAPNGQQALDMARAHTPDLILTDLMMPSMSGWDLCAELGRSERLARVPVAILSGVARMLPRGVLALSKPVQLAEVLALLESILPE